MCWRVLTGGAVLDGRRQPYVDVSATACGFGVRKLHCDLVSVCVFLVSVSGEGVRAENETVRIGFQKELQEAELR